MFLKRTKQKGRKDERHRMSRRVCERRKGESVIEMRRNIEPIIERKKLESF